MKKQLTRILSTLILAAGLTVVAFPAPPAAAQITLPPSDDSFVDVDNPAQNFDGHVDEISVTATGFPLVVKRLGYLRFNLQGISDADMQDISLKLYNQFSIPSNAAVAVFAVASDDWNGSDAGQGSETTLTYNNAPAATIQLDSENGTGAAGWYTFHSVDLTSYVKAQLTENGGDGWVTFQVKVIAGAFAVINSFEDLENGGGTGNIPLLSYVPTAVTLNSFNATPHADNILIQWETATEVDALGFNLYRAEDPEGERLQLNAELIPCQAPGNPVGTSYHYQDDSVTTGATYYYWLEGMEVHGGSTLYGPVNATLADYHYRLYLPLIARE